MFIELQGVQVAKKTLTAFVGKEKRKLIRYSLVTYMAVSCNFYASVQMNIDCSLFLLIKRL